MIPERANRREAGGMILGENWCYTPPPGFPPQFPLPLTNPWSAIPDPPAKQSLPINSIPAITPQAFPPLPTPSAPFTSPKAESFSQESAVWGRDPQLKSSDTLLSSERYQSTFHTERCPKNCANPSCLLAHGSSALRRKPIRQPSGYYQYTNVRCLLTNCVGEKCPFAHSCEEVLYHPEQYKTTTCGNETVSSGGCRLFGVHCPFAHSPAELRTPAPFNSLNPQEVKPNFTSAEIQEKWVKHIAVAQCSKQEKEPDSIDVHTYKIEQCRKPGCRSVLCAGYHHAFDRRRNPKAYSYTSLPCKNVFNSQLRKFTYSEKCPCGDSCHFSHNKFESYYHPQFYKSQPCNYFQTSGACKRGILCAFVHSEKGEKSGPQKSENNENVLGRLAAENQELAMEMGTLKCQVLAMRTSVQAMKGRINCPSCNTREKTVYLTCEDLVCGECWQKMRENKAGAHCPVCKVRASAMGLVRL